LPETQEYVLFLINPKGIARIMASVNAALSLLAAALAEVSLHIMVPSFN
jgi:hypothetical protein